MAKLLLVDDDAKINHIVFRYLRHEGHEVDTVLKGEAAEDLLATQHYDLVILDVMLPDTTGFALLENLRSGAYFSSSASTVPDTAVIMLTALGDTPNVVKGLAGGADDYMSKPFDPSELVQRVSAILRRTAPTSGAQEILHGDLRIDQRSRVVRIGDTQLDLQRRESDLLTFLCQNPAQAFTREELLNKVWGWDYEGSDRAVDICVQRLRYKLKAADSRVVIHTVWGTGYRLDHHE